MKYVSMNANQGYLPKITTDGAFLRTKSSKEMKEEEYGEGK